MDNWGFILWLLGLSVMTLVGVMWLLDISGRQRKLQKRIESIFTDDEGQDLSQPLEALTVRLDVTDERMERLQADLARLGTYLPNSVQAVGLIRFQAFTDYGGDQSFALALANTEGDGVVMSSIFAREGTRVYAKVLEGWTSPHSLSFEEEEAISKAREQLQGIGTPTKKKKQTQKT
jgi:hypothetical protein